MTEQNQHLEEAVSHMEEGMKQFKLYEDTPSSVPELYLEILNLQLEMPDMARLEKPAKPPVPQVSLHGYLVTDRVCTRNPDLGFWMCHVFLRQVEHVFFHFLPNF